MANPWTKKNPVLSMMLSGANTWMSAVHGTLSAQARRQQTAAIRAGTRQVADAWTVALTGKAPRKRSGKKRG